MVNKTASVDFRRKEKRGGLFNFFSPKSSTGNLKRRTESGSFRSLTRKELRVVEAWEKLNTRMKHLAGNCALAGDRFKENQKEFMKEAKKDMQKHAKWHNPMLTRLLRKFYQAKFLEFEISIQIEDMRLKSVLSQQKKIMMMMAALEDNEKVPMSPSEVVLQSQPYELLNTPEIQQQARILKRLQKEKKNTYQAFLQEKDVDRRISHEYRAKVLQYLLDGIEMDTEFDYFTENFTLQDKFDQFLLDERYNEGKQLVHLRKTLQIEMEIEASDILDFLKNFAFSMAKSYSLVEAQFDKLHLFVHRTIFRLIQDFLANFCEAQLLMQPSIQSTFAKSKERLSQMKISELPIDFSFLTEPIENIGIGDAIDIISGLVFETVPRDMIFLIQKTLRLVYKLANENLGKEVGADEMFPLFLYVIIHAFLPNLYQHLVLLKEFILESDKYGEQGYCLVTLEAAFAHISSS